MKLSIKNATNLVLGVGLVGIVAISSDAPAVSQAQLQDATIREVMVTTDGNANQPGNQSKWVFIRTPLIPNTLNDGASPFPVFHNVNAELSAFAVYQKTGDQPDDTQIAKELSTVYENDEIGSSIEKSGSDLQ